ncbi:MAG: bifunctional hydroxymethylpyrimidine kinase/phosphomethylpyrimidine kinase [Alysiella sp.]|uniref:bifunctional hydroxymethylpyrimidine kinase/phosphomethylpyrimidine kinase n=1 Tax=Alysiella sp. TaxID=1872483 RepID=UPI0026DDA93F|nr:bifunctional hydroxymethylpyrimidine kinase/phosphomethylpyrimidine kinase [Alysiella sp.]MDO4433481.1 bifunctional hydroxymethylpyrimidine kinase/phosphomethylpyrimidine kinase [Alysiella sp.]
MVAQVLTIAGSDSGGGAGIQADLKTFQMRGTFGMSVITAVTAQNTLGVCDIHTIPTHTIATQIQAIAEDFRPTAFKIGMLGTAEVIECVANALQNCSFGLLVLDPVMIAKGGAPLLHNDAVSALKQLILPMADVITPNLPETEVLTGIQVNNTNDAFQAALQLQKMGVKNVVIKGGHRENSQSAVCHDWVFLADGTQLTLSSPRFDTRHTHGTGCTFSACLAAELAKSENMANALQTAKSFIYQAISNPIGIGSGHGAVNHWASGCVLPETPFLPNQQTI